MAPIAGETKVWQYVTLMKKIYLIDCPGVVYPTGEESDEDKVLRGVVRVELVQDPTVYIEGLLRDEIVNMAVFQQGQILKEYYPRRQYSLRFAFACGGSLISTT